MRWMVLALVCLGGARAEAQKFDALAKTPPMGWNSWNKFGCNVNEAIVHGVVDAMVSSGMRDAGYLYVVIDDCWHGPRDALGNITADRERFPSGMRALSGYVHAHGLKFGIYSDAGRTTCSDDSGSGCASIRNNTRIGNSLCKPGAGEMITLSMAIEDKTLWNEVHSCLHGESIHVDSEQQQVNDLGAFISSLERSAAGTSSLYAHIRMWRIELPCLFCPSIDAIYPAFARIWVHNVV